MVGNTVLNKVYEVDSGAKTTVFSSEGPSDQHTLTRQDLVKASYQVRNLLKKSGVEKGDRVAIFLETSVELVATILGTWAINGITTILPNRWPKRMESIWEKRLAAILATAEPSAIVLHDELVARFQVFLSSRSQAIESAPVIIRASDVRHCLKGSSEVGPFDLPEPDDVAHIQFTSGTTGAPKGAPVTHGQLLGHLQLINRRMEFSSSDCSVSWLPLYHDLGFIGGFLAPLVMNYDQILIPTESFVRNPMVWLQAVSDHKATLTPTPTFAMNLIGRRASSDQIKQLDLSSLRCMWVGAEPVFVESVERFQQALHVTGMNPDVISPCYGLAEATLVVSMPTPGTKISWQEFDGQRVISVGSLLEDTQVQVKPLDESELNSLSEGQIFISGPGVIQSYWGEAIDNSGSIDTGDLGFLHDGNLFITGREKDLIIHSGVNLHPHWIEQAVTSLSDFQSGPMVLAVCAYSYKDPSIQREKIGVVVELRGRFDSKTFSSFVRKRILDIFSVPLDFVHICKPGAIPRTTSGKIQRRMCAELFSS